MSLDAPFCWINFKAYPGTFGDDGRALLRTIERVQAETGVTFLVSPATTELRWAATNADVSIMAQHVDAAEPGRGMGRVLPSMLREAGVTAVVINHAESRHSLDDIASLIPTCRDQSLHTVVGAHGIDAARAVLTLGPDTLVCEVPEDIATDRAISVTHPAFVRSCVELRDDVSPDTNVFVGGGIATEADVEAAFELGVDAVGAASAVVDSPDPIVVLRDLAAGFP